MKPSPTATTKPTDTAAVDAYMQTLKHPLADLAALLRKTILAADKSIGEEIKWNAPAFFFTGPMEPFNPKEYRRHLVVFNFYRKDCIRLVFWHGDRANDQTGFLEGAYSDGRRLAVLAGADELKDRKKAMLSALKAQLRHMR
ncbi:MAG: hypothetical protein CFE39_00780 [Comamonadaceae bacterium PBBC2]|nr:MAG: hypothetical protein CFE39_00780 [Comamonadaceae bacterium PBBC2]